MLVIIPMTSFMIGEDIVPVSNIVRQNVITMHIQLGMMCFITNGYIGISASLWAIYVLTKMHNISSIIIQ